ncbi:MAG TPA: AAA family ATPase, partial [Acidimicrobiales bacterium]|nr:AAA family ATPase [Acidimicrobiales bacterium]
RAEQAGATVAWGHCIDRGPPPFWPWVEVLRSVLAAPGGRDELMGWERIALAQILPELSAAEPPTPIAADPSQARYQLYSAAGEVLVRATGSRPLCIVLDDLHWADLPSLQLLTHIAVRAGGARLLLAGTYRDTEVGDDFGEALGALVREPESEQLRLNGLTVGEVATFVGNATGVQPSAPLAASLHSRTAGNPFFLTELVRLLESEHALDGDVELPVSGQVPPGVREVIRRRLARLPEQTNVLLTIGAVAGSRFDHRLLEAIGGLGEERTLELMEVAIVTGIVADDPQQVGRYRFSHPLIRQTVYDGLSTVRRARLHARVAEGLAALHGDGATVDMAHHLWSAAEEADARATLPVVLRAAEIILGQLAYEEAAEQLRRAAVLLQTPPQDAHAAGQELVVQLRLAQLLAMTRGSRAPETEGALARAHELTELVGHEAELLPALWGLLFAQALRCDLEPGRQLALHLLELYERNRDPLFELAGHLGLGIMVNLGGDLTLAHEEFTTATALADARTEPGLAATFQMDPAALARSLHSTVLALRGDFKGAEELAEAATTLATARGDRLASVIAYLCGGLNAILAGDVDAVEDLVPKAEAIATATGFKGLQAMAMGLCAWALGERGDTQGAVAGVRDSLALHDSTGNGWGRSLHVVILAQMERDPARRAGVLDAIDEQLAPSEAGEWFLAAELLRLRAELLATFPERHAEALASATRAVEVARQQGAAGLEERAGATLARIRTANHPSERGPSRTSTDGTAAGSASRSIP